MNRRLPRPSIPLAEVRHWEGAADPAYLLGELKELRSIVERSGPGTLAYILELACIKARER